MIRPRPTETVSRSSDADFNARHDRRMWWLGFVVSPVVGIVVMIVITFVIFRFPLPFTR